MDTIGVLLLARDKQCWVEEMIPTSEEFSGYIRHGIRDLNTFILIPCG